MAQEKVKIEHFFVVLQKISVKIMFLEIFLDVLTTRGTLRLGSVAAALV